MSFEKYFVVCQIKSSACVCRIPESQQYICVVEFSHKGRV